MYKRKDDYFSNKLTLFRFILSFMVVLIHVVHYSPSVIPKNNLLSFWEKQSLTLAILQGLAFSR